MAFLRHRQAAAKPSLWLSAATMALAVFSGGVICAAAEQRSPSIAHVHKSTSETKLSAPYTQLLAGAPVKAPVFFADEKPSSGAKVKQASWYRYGYPSYAYYRGYGGWYGPWYGRGAYGYYGVPYGGYWSSFYRPYGYGTLNPYAYSLPYYYGSGAYPLYTGGFYPNYAYYGAPYYSALYSPYVGAAPYDMGAAPYSPYGMGGYDGGGGYGGAGGYGGCCYW